MSAIHLDPCPRCAGISMTIITRPGTSKYLVSCPCGAKGPEIDDASLQSPGIAAAEWNTWVRAKTLLGEAIPGDLLSSREGLPPAYGGCTCSCHRRSGVMHVVPCCGPGRRSDGDLTR